MGSNAEYAMGQLMAKNTEGNARIAELATEVADLKAKLDFANAMNADQDKTVAELTAEVARLRAALHECAFKPNWIDDCQAVARNALEETK